MKAMQARLCRKNQLLFIAALLLALRVERSHEGKQNTALYFRSIEKSYNPKYVDSFACNISTDRSTISTSLNIAKNVSVDFWMKVAIAFKQQASKKYRSILSFNVNLCEVLRNEFNQQGLVHLWIRNLQKYSNMPRTCPWKAGSYYWLNLRPEAGTIPKFISAGLFRIDTQFYLKALNNEPFTNVTIVFELHRD
ncbi:uncharacterized protein LOC126762631 [Bactrocera neohumeralis]|uniref:uncharacterized protein LOC120778412 n=1 Tax=Bactrocera tryoni TaxID=59916 RepID=UPI001A97F39E|nr:uncharacterized protein LOC120778412 [Bactrocera tryoni]XP_050335465.1 uncharacterized protein LOC126762631 [Bactrocera neohumeralis]